MLAMRSFWSTASDGEPQGDSGDLDTAPEESWPWHRFFYGMVVNFLYRSGARAVLLDIDFSGRGPRDDLDGDSLLTAQLLKRAPIAYLAINFKHIPEAHRAEAGSYLRRLAGRSETIIKHSAVQVPGAERFGFEREAFTTAQVPYRELEPATAARGLGFVNAKRSAADSVRRALLFIRYQDYLVPSISLAAARDLLKAERMAISADGDLYLDDRRIPLDDHGRMLINWYGDVSAFKGFTIHEAIKIAFADYERTAGTDPAEDPLQRGWSEKIGAEEVEAYRRQFQNAVVLIGASAAELGDVCSTPFSDAFPGAGVHATVLGNLLHDQILSRASFLARLGILLALAVAAGIGSQLIGGEKKGFVFFVVCIALYGAIAGYAFKQHLLWLDLAVPIFTAAMAYGSSALVDYLRTGRQKRLIRQTFDRVLQPDLVDHLLADPARVKLGGETRELTVLFSDLENSTGISERFSPATWVETLNRYFTECTEIILRRGACLDKYIGDGIMAFWGAPVAMENHAEQACLAALELRGQLKGLREVLREEYQADLVTRIGINTGRMLVGMVGGTGKVSYTVMGGPVNVSSRLEGANSVYGTQILIGADTFSATDGAIEVREIDQVVLKGTSEPTRIYEPLSPTGALDDQGRDLRAAYEEGLAQYRSRRWEEAISWFEKALAIVPEDGPARALMERTRRFTRNEPPEDWNGAFTIRYK